MITRKTLRFAVTLTFILFVENIKSERWSRQVSNSEWIPLTQPKTTQRHQAQPQGKAIENEGVNGLLTAPDQETQQQQVSPQVQLSPALQHQYQEQLLQLQKTQENIQKLLLLQQQLKNQQRLLQSQAYAPSAFSSPDINKQAIHQSEILNLQTDPELAPELLVPPLPSSEALPPIYGAQNFHAQNPETLKHDYSRTKETANTAVDESDYREGHDESIISAEGHETEGHRPDPRLQYNLKQGVHYQVTKPRKKEQSNNHKNFGPLSAYTSQESGDDEEIQLVYVPAETLAQRGQPKTQRNRVRKPNQYKQQYHQESQETPTGNADISSNQDAFAHVLLQQLQRKQNQFLEEERLKEISRLNEEQKEIEKQAKLQQETIRKEQDLKRQRDEEKQRKELEKLEEQARQRELQRLRQDREKQKLAEIERKRLAEIRAKEEKRKKQEEEEKRREETRQELVRLATIEREDKAQEQQKELNKQRLQTSQEIRQQKIWSDVQQGQSQLNQEQEQPQALPLIREPHPKQQIRHLPETTKTIKSNRIRNRLRPKIHQHHHHHHHQSNNRDRQLIGTTTPSPNQPPLAVYMNNIGSETRTARITDVLKLLKNAKTIPVLDSVGPDSPKVFVGPSSLDPPARYVKFDLPYLSSIENNRVERKVEKLPFFVAPLNFEPPPGYSKIPFPAPHIGSVVINTLDAELESENPHHNHHPRPTPIIKHNSYTGNDQQSTPAIDYEIGTTIPYADEPSSTSKYDNNPSKNHGNARFRFRQSYGEGKSSTPSVVTAAASYQDERTSSSKIERPAKYRPHYSSNIPSSTPSYHNPRIVSSVTYQASVSESTPRYQERIVNNQQESNKQDKLDAQLALINKEIAYHRQAINGYKNPEQQQRHQYTSTNPSTVNPYYGESDKYEDSTSVIGLTQYSLPVELPAISPHLPGLVNALVEKNDADGPITTTMTTTTTTTTTTEPPTTTYRSRGRQRSRVSTRATTTTSRPSSRSTANDRSRRPYNRSRTRITTTTEAYQEMLYNPTKSKIEETTQRYESELRRRPATRNQKQRGQNIDHRTTQTVNHRNTQSQAINSYENVATEETPTTTINFSQTPSVSTLNLPIYQRDDYSPSTNNPIDNYPPNDATSSSISREPISYSRKTTYQPNLHSQQVQYDMSYEIPNANKMRLDEQPVNGFNYQAQTGNPISTTPQTLRDYSYYHSDKTDEIPYEQPDTTVTPRSKRPQQHQEYIPTYNQGQMNYDVPVDDFERTENVRGAYYQTGLKDGQSVEPAFVPIPQSDKPEDYVFHTSEVPQDIVTRRTTVGSTTSESPLIIRQKIRTRLGGRIQQDSAVQTQPRGSHDEYVRFSTINQDSERISSSNNRQRDKSSRSRPKIRPQSTYNSPVQTEGQEYVRIQTAQNHRSSIASSTTPAREEEEEEEIDYGFIRTPNFPPVQSEEKFETPNLYRQHLQNQVPAEYIETGDVSAIDSSPTQAQILKNRQKYNIPNRRPSVKVATTPTSSTVSKFAYATTSPDEAVYTTRSSTRNDETKSSKVRGRVRRPSARRRITTSTTEASLEANNELPIDENYPRIIQTIQRPLLNPRPVVYEDSYEQEQIPILRNSTSHYHDRSEENYPSEELLLNYGILPAQDDRLDEYDQAPLASHLPRKYNQEHLRPYPTHIASDIYGAESQWSTKLSQGSFQPSNLPNEAVDFNKFVGKEDDNGDAKKSEQLVEIITAGPDVSSITVLVNSEYDKKNTDIESTSKEAIMEMMDFGKKTNVQNQVKLENATTTPDVYQERTGQESDLSLEQSTTKFDQLESLTKNMINPLITRKNGQRRRRIRVRVRPVDDFVTSESQHYDKSHNNLVRNSSIKNNRIPDMYTTTQSSMSTATHSNKDGSILNDFIQEMFENNEESLMSNTNVNVKTTTAALDEAWTTTTNTIPIQEENETTLKEQISTTTENYSSMKTLTTIIDQTKSEELKHTFFEEEHYISSEDDQNSKMIKKNETSIMLNSSNKTIQDGETNSNKNQEQKSAEQVENSTKHTEFDILNKNYDNQEIFSRFMNDAKESLKIDEGEDPTPEDHPKNHRTKWSEVRYPSDRSILDYAKYYSNNYENRTSDLKKITEQVPSVMTYADGASNTKTLSDYVKDIFESIKGAENQNYQSTEQSLNTSTDINETTTMEITTDKIFEDSTENNTEPSEVTTTMEPVKNSNFIGKNFGKVLRTSTTTKVSHMTEICYRGKCVMTRPKREDSFR